MHLDMTLAGGFIALLLVVCSPGFSAENDEVDAAIDRGMAWIMAHPATPRDGGFQDLVDEGLFYLSVRRLSSGKTFAALHERAFQDCISRLEASPGFKWQLKKQNKVLIEHYHLLLATYLMETVRKPVPGHDRVIRDAQRALVNNRFENPTFRLTVAQLLKHLGATPQVSMDELLDASLINRIAKGDASMFPRQLHAYYALVHEIAALTDFGRLPASPWLIEHRSLLDQILQEGSRRAMVSAHIDLLAEMLLCRHMLGLAMNGEQGAGIEYLVASQRADGTWGEQATPRANRMRHAVQTATTALLAYQTTSQAH